MQLGENAGHILAQSIGYREHIVILDDDQDFLKAFGSFLTTCHYAISGICSEEEALEVLDGGSVDLVLVDVMLQPGTLTGLDFVPTIQRRHPEVAVVVITCLSDTATQVRGLGLGVDGFLRKGDSPEVIEATLRNILDRRYARPRPRLESPGVVLPSWRLNPVNWRLHGPSGVAARLTYAEFCILETLSASDGRMVSRTHLLEAIGKTNTPKDSRNLDTLISRLRRKVKSTTGIDLPLSAAYGSGYVFTAPIQILGNLGGTKG